MEESSAPRHRWLIPALIAAGTVLRLYALDRHSLWFDEACIPFQAADLSAVLDGRMLVVHPPLFFVIFHFWSLLGDSDWIWRLLPALLGILSIPAAAWAFDRDRPTGRTAAALVTFSPFLIYYSQELKMYSLLALEGFLLLGSLDRAVHQRSRRSWFAVGLILITAAYTHYYALLYAAALLLYVLGLDRRSRRPILWVQLALAASLLPWLPVLVRMFREVAVTRDFWIPGVPVWAVPLTLVQLLLGYGTPLWALLLGGLCIVAAAASGLAALEDRAERARTLTLLLVPPLLAFATSKLAVNELYLTRCLVLSAPPLVYLVARGLVAPPPRWLPLAPWIGVALALCFGWTLMHQYENRFPLAWAHPGVAPKIDSRGAAAHIQERRHEGEGVLHYMEHTLIPFRRYYGLHPEDVHVSMDPERFYRYPNETESRREGIFPHPLPEVFERFESAWLVLSWWSVDPERDAASQALVDWLEAHALETERKAFHGIQLRRYRSLQSSGLRRRLARTADDGRRAAHRLVGEALPPAPPDLGTGDRSLLELPRGDRFDAWDPRARIRAPENRSPSYLWRAECVEQVLDCASMRWTVGKEPRWRILRPPRSMQAPWGDARPVGSRLGPGQSANLEARLDLEAGRYRLFLRFHRPPRIHKGSNDPDPRLRVRFLQQGREDLLRILPVGPDREEPRMEWADLGSFEASGGPGSLRIEAYQAGIEASMVVLDRLMILSERGTLHVRPWNLVTSDLSGSGWRAEANPPDIRPIPAEIRLEPDEPDPFTARGLFEVPRGLHEVWLAGVFPPAEPRPDLTVSFQGRAIGTLPSELEAGSRVVQFARLGHLEWIGGTGVLTLQASRSAASAVTQRARWTEILLVPLRYRATSQETGIIAPTWAAVAGGRLGPLEPGGELELPIPPLRRQAGRRLRVEVREAGTGREMSLDAPLRLERQGP